MHEALVTIASFASAVEADYARIILEDEGITASVDGAAAATALSIAGTSAIGARLLVFESDAARALEIIETIESEPEAAGEAWYCGKCRAQVDAGFDDCWSCGESREDVGQPFPESDRPPDKQIDTQSSGYSVDDPLNPYSPPESDAKAPSTDSPPETVLSHQAEAMVLRAWRGAIIGMFLIPFLVSIYSMILLIRATTMCDEFSPKGTRRFYQAVVINLLAGAFWGVLIARSFF